MFWTPSPQSVMVNVHMTDRQICWLSLVYLTHQISASFSNTCSCARHHHGGLGLAADRVYAHILWTLEVFCSLCPVFTSIMQIAGVMYIMQDEFHREHSAVTLAVFPWWHSKSPSQLRHGGCICISRRIEDGIEVCWSEERRITQLSPPDWGPHWCWYSGWIFLPIRLSICFFLAFPIFLSHVSCEAFADNLQ